MSRQTRRAFLKTTAAGAALTFAGASAFGQESTKKKKKAQPKLSDRIIGANERVRVGVAGINGRGGSHIDAFSRLPGVEVAYLIDPDSRLFEPRSGSVKRLAGNTPKCFQDIRKALEEKELNAVSIATCNHWHSLITYWACQANKDVYVEKPCSHNVFEGRKIVEAAEKYKRIVQHGTQSRSDPKWAHACAAAQSGKYGKLLVSKTWASKVRWSIGFKPDKEPPKELDYDLWLGPAYVHAKSETIPPKELDYDLWLGPDHPYPYNANYVHYNWHWFWPFGNGELANQGVHQMDIARWSVGELTGPITAISMGGRWVDTPDFKDQGQTPNEQLIVIDIGGTLIVYEIRGLNGKKGPGGGQFAQHVDNEFYLEAGTIKGGKFYPKGKNEPENLVKVDYKLGPSEKGAKGDLVHFSNFIEAVRSRKVEDLNAPVTTGHPSTLLCHLGNISYRLGVQTPFGKGYDALGHNEYITASIKAIEEQLVGALGMDLSKFTYQLGAKLRFDPATEKFIDNPEADKLLTRRYRDPFRIG